MGELALVHPATGELALDVVVTDLPGGVERSGEVRLVDVQDQRLAAARRAPWWRDCPRRRRSSRPAVPAAPSPRSGRRRLRGRGRWCRAVPGCGGRTRGPARTTARRARPARRSAARAPGRRSGRCRCSCRPGSRTARCRTVAPPQPVLTLPLKNRVRAGWNCWFDRANTSAQKPSRELMTPTASQARSEFASLPVWQLCATSPVSATLLLPPKLPALGQREPAAAPAELRKQEVDDQPDDADAAAADGDAAAHATATTAAATQVLDVRGVQISVLVEPHHCLRSRFAPWSRGPR